MLVSNRITPLINITKFIALHPLTHSFSYDWTLQIKPSTKNTHSNISPVPKAFEKHARARLYSNESNTRLIFELFSRLAECRGRMHITHRPIQMRPPCGWPVVVVSFDRPPTGPYGTFLASHGLSRSHTQTHAQRLTHTLTHYVTI